VRELAARRRAGSTCLNVHDSGVGGCGAVCGDGPAAEAAETSAMAAKDGDADNDKQREQNKNNSDCKRDRFHFSSVFFAFLSLEWI
jgi:hypothetical protein